MISEFPLLVFTTLAGLAAGSYTMSAFFPVGQGSKRPWLFPLVCLVLLAAGLLCLPAHLEHPERMLIALSNPSAMIAQEAYWSIGFGIVLLADVVLSKAKGRARERCASWARWPGWDLPASWPTRTSCRAPSCRGPHGRRSRCS